MINENIAGIVGVTNFAKYDSCCSGIFLVSAAKPQVKISWIVMDWEGKSLSTYRGEDMEQRMWRAQDSRRKWQGGPWEEPILGQSLRNCARSHSSFCSDSIFDWLCKKNRVKSSYFSQVPITKCLSSAPSKQDLEGYWREHDRSDPPWKIAALQNEEWLGPLIEVLGRFPCADPHPVGALRYTLCNKANGIIETMRGQSTTKNFFQYMMSKHMLACTYVS